MFDKEKYQGMLDRLAERADIASISVGVSAGGEEQFFSAGRRDLDAADLPTSHTVYQIGSCTKSFTAAGIAMLAGEGKLELDAPVKKYIPEFAVADDYLTLHITLRDMLCHRTGTPGYELAWMPFLDEYDGAKLIDQMKYYKANLPFRYEMQYSNPMYMLLGRVIERVSGMEWDKFIRERLLEPIGMNETYTDPLKMAADATASRPYEKRNGVLTRVPYSHIRYMAPAGDMASTASDMLKWIRFNMAGGKLGNMQLIDATAMEECHIPQMLIKQGAFDYMGMPGKRQMSYGFGWFVEDYNGRRVVQHGGNIDGYCAMISYAPEVDCAVTVLVNSGHAMINETLPYYFFDDAMGLGFTDHTEDVRAFIASAEDPGEGGNESADTVALPAPDIKELEGAYENEFYGRFNVFIKDGVLSGRLGSFEARFTHTTGAGYHVVMPSIDEEYVINTMFCYNIDGKICALTMNVGAGGEDIRYDKIS